MKINNIYLLVGLIAVLSLLSVSDSFTVGNVVIRDFETPVVDSSGAQRLHDRALRFFDVDEIVFPRGVCIPVAHELYGDVAYVPVDVTVGYGTSGYERLSSLNFVLSESNRNERYGTIDFVKSPTFLAEKDTDSFISISSEAIIRPPKATRKTYLVMDLYGVTRNSRMFITKGRFSIPSVDCIFVIEKGKALCDCDVHTIKGIAVGGLTSASAVEERYLDLVERARKKSGGRISGVSKEGDIIISEVNLPELS